MSATPETADSPWWDDLIDIFVSPGTLFARRAITPKFGIALLVLVIGIIALYYLTATAMAPIFDAEFRRGAAAAMRNNPQLTLEQMEGFRGMSEKVAGLLVAGAIGVGAVLLGLAIWVTGKIFGAGLDFARAITIATFALFPRLVEFVLNAAQALVLPEESLTSRYSVSLGVGRFLDPATTGPAIQGLLGRVDLITLWVSFLILLGFEQVGKLSRTQALGATLVVWLLGALPAVWGAFTAAG